MRVDKVLNLAEWGFNVPAFIHNPIGHYGDDAYLCLKEIFSYVQNKRYFSVLATNMTTGKSSYSKGLSLQSAHVSCIPLERRGNEVLIFVEYPKEFSGSVVLFKEGVSCFTYDDKLLKFYDVMQIENLVHRHIVREVCRIKEKVNVESIRVRYVWSKEFGGILGTRLLFLDYRIE